LVYLAASGDRERAVVLLKKAAVAVNYGREVSVVARLSQAENPALEICRCCLRLKTVLSPWMPPQMIKWLSSE
jgi:hypothetical protein